MKKNIVLGLGAALAAVLMPIASPFAILLGLVLLIAGPSAGERLAGATALLGGLLGVFLLIAPILGAISLNICTLCCTSSWGSGQQ